MRYYFFETKKTQKHLEVMKDEIQIREEGKEYILGPVHYAEEIDYVERKEHEKRLNQILGNLNQRKCHYRWFQRFRKENTFKACSQWKKKELFL
jgi:hypothetical protein